MMQKVFARQTKQDKPFMLEEKLNGTKVNSVLLKYSSADGQLSRLSVSGYEKSIKK